MIFFLAFHLRVAGYATSLPSDEPVTFIIVPNITAANPTVAILPIPLASRSSKPGILHTDFQSNCAAISFRKL